ncbi:MAG: APC family permease [Actinomycetota bacterium]|nr:APC family permease [Actinomycetota bacterium]
MEATGGQTTLRRAISSRMLLIFVVGDILGAGIYALVGEVGAEVGGAIWTAFTAALVLAVFTACAYAELVTKYPRAAGAALYVNRAYRLPFLTFMVAFAVMASGITSASTLSRAFAGDYFKEFIDLPLVLVALGAILVVAAINLRGISESVKVNVALTLVEVGGLLLILVIGAVALGQGDADFARNFEFKEGESVFLAIIGGASLAFYALIGFEDSVNVAEEARDPSRAFPRALFGGLLIAGVIYLLVTLTASMVVETGQLSGSSGPLLEVVRQGPLGISTKLFSFIALLAVINGALINMIMASRLVYGMSKQRIVPEVFGRVLNERRTPYVAIAFTTLLAAILISTGDLSDLADTTVLLLLFVFTIVNATVLVLRRDPVEHEHFRAPSILPALGAVVSVALIVDTATDDLEVFARAGLLLLLGALLWGVNRLITGPVDEVDPEVLG